MPAFSRNHVSQDLFLFPRSRDLRRRYNDRLRLEHESADLVGDDLLPVWSPPRHAPIRRTQVTGGGRGRGGGGEAALLQQPNTPPQTRQGLLVLYLDDIRSPVFQKYTFEWAMAEEVAFQRRQQQDLRSPQRSQSWLLERIRKYYDRMVANIAAFRIVGPATTAYLAWHRDNFTAWRDMWLRGYPIPNRGRGDFWPWEDPRTEYDIRYGPR